MVAMLCLAMLVMSGTAFAQQCVDNGDKTVTHKTSSLMWQKDTAGPMTWDEAMSYASSLSLGGHSGWRLPEMHTLLDLFYSPCRKIIILVGDWYWSATTHPSDPTKAWRVNFDSGLVDYGNKSSSYYVRAVRYVK